MRRQPINIAGRLLTICRQTGDSSRNNEPDTRDPAADSEAASVSASVNTGAVPTFELSKPADPSGREAWWEVEGGCFVDENLHPLPPLEQEGLASTPAQDQLHSRRHSPLGHHRTRPTHMTVMEPREVHQRNQRPIIYLHHWRRTVEEGVRETSLNLKGTYNWLSKSKRSCRPPLLAPHAPSLATKPQQYTEPQPGYEGPA